MSAVPRLIPRADGSVWAVVAHGMADKTLAYALRGPDGWAVKRVQDPRPAVVVPTEAEARRALADMTGATP